ncbi:MAG TPA: hypothetical protein VGL77_14815 [Armatimonadota bacterium]|jgi:hypothetical protein
MYLALLETAGNQRYIFATNKLRENVGASELTYRAGTQWVLESVDTVLKRNGHTPLALWDTEAQVFRDRLRQHGHRCAEIRQPVEVVVVTSGKAILLIQAEKIAQDIIREVTAHALREAPGLDLCGCYIEWKDSTPIGDALRMVHHRYEVAHSGLPGPVMRFMRLPFFAECATSGLPANTLQHIEGQDNPPRRVSATVSSKRDVVKPARTRLDRVLRRVYPDFTFADNIDNLTGDWHAIIHADGNGLGQLFLKFDEYINQNALELNREYLSTYREFSIALEECTEAAFMHALHVIPEEAYRQETTVPLVPLVLGGDDLTVICDGKYALNFARAFLQAFERFTGEHTVIRAIAAQVSSEDTPYLSSCAGVAIIKPNFPFFTAYDLAEDLLHSAKIVKNEIVVPCSALDFHVLHDSSVVTLSSIRAHLQLQDASASSSLYTRPYIISDLPPDDLERIWVERRTWGLLVDRAKKLRHEEDGRRQLPTSQMHMLRAGLFDGRLESDALYAAMAHRYEKQGIRAFEGDAGSLFHREPVPGDVQKVEYATGLLDAMDAADFLTHTAEGRPL